MKIKKIVYCLFIFSLFTNTFILVNAKEKSKMKHFACKLITLNGKSYQTLLLGTDWKEFNNNENNNIILNESKYQKTNNKIDINALILNNELKISIHANEYKKLTFNIVNIYGSVLEIWDCNIVNGDSRITKNISSIAKGCYLLNIYYNCKYLTTVKILNL